MIILYGILVLLAGAFIYIYHRYHSFDPENRDIEVNLSDLEYFSEDYDTARNGFLADVNTLKESYPGTELISFRVDSKKDSELYMDICYIPPAGKKKKLFVLVSGTHGIEGYTGGAVQQLFITEILDRSLLNDTGVLLVHSFNPYGQKYFRKTTEENIDLNRNCPSDPALFMSSNKGFTRMYRLLCPKGKVNKNTPYNRFFYIAAVWKILKESFSALRQSALQGQYDCPEGIYYGGKKYTTQTLALKETLKAIFAEYILVFAVDIHTAYGKWGRLHLFPNPEPDERLKKQISSLFKGYPIHWGDTADFYTIVGDLSGFLKGLNPEATILCMPFEFGTMNSHLFLGSLVSIHRMILENQGHFHGYRNTVSKDKVLHDYKEMYYPSSERWRSEVIQQSRRMLKLCLTRFQAMKTEK